jgi:hypothetical protein
VFSVALGSLGQADDLTDLDWNNDSLYLQIDLDADGNSSFEESFATRKRLTAVSYAFNSRTVGGFAATSTAAAANNIPVFDSSLTLNLFNGGVSSTRATSTDLYVSNQLKVGTTTSIDSGAAVFNGVILGTGTAYFGNLNSDFVNSVTDFLGTTNIGVYAISDFIGVAGGLGDIDSTGYLGAIFDDSYNGYNRAIYGVNGIVTESTTTAVNIGVYGSASSGAVNYAGYFNGNLFTTGNATTSGKLYGGNGSRFGSDTIYQRITSQFYNGLGVSAPTIQFKNEFATVGYDELGIIRKGFVLTETTSAVDEGGWPIIYWSNADATSMAAIFYATSTDLLMIENDGGVVGVSSNLTVGTTTVVDSSRLTIDGQTYIQGLLQVHGAASGSNLLQVTTAEEDAVFSIMSDGDTRMSFGLFASSTSYFDSLVSYGNATTSSSLTVGNLPLGADVAQGNLSVESDIFVGGGITLGGVYRTTWPSGGGGGSASSFWVTTTDSLIGYPDLSGGYAIVVGGSATTTGVSDDLRLEVRSGDFGVDLASETFFVDASNNRIGIGTISPTSTLVVRGDLNVKSSAGASALFVLGGSGRVGVNTSTPGGTYGENLTVAGSSFVTGNATTTGIHAFGNTLTVSGTATSTFAGNISIANGKNLQVSHIYGYSPITINSETIFTGVSRIPTINATTTNVGTLNVYSGGSLSGLFTATDLRASVLNSTTTNVGTFRAYTGSTLSGLTTAADLRSTVLNASTTAVGTLRVFGGTITGDNSETIGIGATDDLITFSGAGGSDNTNIYFNLDGALPYIYSNTDGAIKIDDRLYVGSVNDASISGDVSTDGVQMIVQGVDSPTDGTLMFATESEYNDLVGFQAQRFGNNQHVLHMGYQFSTDSTFNPALTMYYDGKIGIGTTTPSAELSIVGNAGDGDAIAAIRIQEDTGTDAFYELRVDDNIGNAFSIYGGLISAPADRFTILSSGKIGVGTTTPASPLVVYTVSTQPQDAVGYFKSNVDHANVFIDAAASKEPNLVFAENYENHWAIGTELTTNRLRVRGSDFGTEYLTMLTDGKLGVGDITPASLFTVGSGDLFQVNSSGNIVKINNVTYSWPASQGGVGTVLTNNGSGTLTWGSASSGGWTDGGSDVYLTTLTDEVGIGTNSPTEALHIYSSTSNVTTTIALENTQSNSDTSIEFKSFISNLFSVPYMYSLVSDGAGGDLSLRFGLDVASPEFLTVKYDAISALTNYEGFFGFNDSEPASVIDATANDDIVAHLTRTNDNTVLRLQDSDGTCNYNPESGSVTVSCSSDERLKTNITDTEDALEELLGYRVRDYTVIASGDVTTGVIAQEIQQIMPQVVSEDDQGYLMVTEPNVWKLVKAIQELKYDIDELSVSVESYNNQGQSMQNFSVTNSSDVEINNLVVQQAATFYGTIYVRGEAGFEHKVTFKDDVLVHGKLYVSSDQAGRVLLPAGSGSVTVTFEESFADTPNVVVTPRGNPGGAFWVSDESVDGFTIYISGAVGYDVEFSWIAMANVTSFDDVGQLNASVTQTEIDLPVILSLDGAPQSAIINWSISPNNIGVIEGNGNSAVFLVPQTQADIIGNGMDITIVATVVQGSQSVDRSVSVRILPAELTINNGSGDSETPPQENEAPPEDDQVLSQEDETPPEDDQVLPQEDEAPPQEDNLAEGE